MIAEKEIEIGDLQTAKAGIEAERNLQAAIHKKLEARMEHLKAAAERNFEAAAADLAARTGADAKSVGKGKQKADAKAMQIAEQHIQDLNEMVKGLMSEQDIVTAEQWRLQSQESFANQDMEDALRALMQHVASQVQTKLG